MLTPDLQSRRDMAAPERGQGLKNETEDRDPLSPRSTDHVGQLLLMIVGWLTDVPVNGTLEVYPPTDLTMGTPTPGGHLSIPEASDVFVNASRLLCSCTGVMYYGVTQKDGLKSD